MCVHHVPFINTWINIHIQNNIRGKNTYINTHMGSAGVAMDSPPVSGRGDAPGREERGPGRSDGGLGVGADLTSSVSPD